MTVLATLPPAHWFSFPPTNNPVTLVPPHASNLPSVVSSPFTIPPSVFHAALDVRVPLTIASVYAVTVHILNGYNARRSFAPWRISKTRTFHWLVVLHNVFLAVYSAWTFYGMTSALGRSINTSQGLTGVVDSLCKLHGPQTVGNATTYAVESFRRYWVSPEPLTGLLAPTHPPSPYIPGRMWNEGLAFYGWLFYLSKFYEVIDTLVILAKGKKSSTLQTYHHAGAMLCMWAGIKYMAPPIWMFVFLNSFIHSLMYTYYTITAFSVRVPKALKRSLTTLQIAQFLFGGSYAFIHFFISYTVPTIVDTPSSTPNGAQHHLHKITRTVRCVDTSGEAFAIGLNVLYLAPLTWLFVRFFVRSYLATGSSKGGKVGRGHAVEKATVDAAKGVGREVADL